MPLLSKKRTASRLILARFKRPPAIGERRENAKDLNGIANQPVCHDEWRSWDHKLACSRNSAGSANFGVTGKQCFNVLNNVKCNASRGRRIVLFNVGR